MPSSGWSASSAAGPSRARGGEAGVGRVRLGEGARRDRSSARRSARGSRARPRRGGPRPARASSISPDRRRAAISWARRRVRSVIVVVVPMPSAASVAAEDRRDDDEVARRARRRCARTASTGSDWRTTSSRRMFSSSIVWAVGGICVGVEPGRIAYWSRMWLSWPSSTAELLVGQAEAGEMGDVLDVGAGQAGHGADDSQNGFATECRHRPSAS